MASPLIHENVWFEKTKYEAAERQYYERLAKALSGTGISFSLKSTSTILIPSFKASVKQSVCLDSKNFVDCCAKYTDASDKEVDDALSAPAIVSSPNITMSAPLTQLKDEKRSKKGKRNKNSEKKKRWRDQVRTSTIASDSMNGNEGAFGNADSDDIESSDQLKTQVEIKYHHPSKKLQSKDELPSGKVAVSGLQEKIEVRFSDTVSRNFQSSMDGEISHNMNSVVFSEGSNQYCGYVADLPITQNIAKTCFATKSASQRNAFLSEPSTFKAEQDMNIEKASSITPMKNSLASEVAKARQHIKESLECMDDIAAMAGTPVDLINRINSLEKENADLNKIVAELKNLVLSLDSRVKTLEGSKSVAPVASITTAKETNIAKSKNTDDDDDDGVDLFGSDSEEESEEAAKVREARLAAYAAKKSKKPALIAKSNIILSVSPWDDETDMKKMEECVRSIEMDGLVWGASKLVPLAYGINKLHISCVVEDDKVSIDLLQEKIQDFEDYVQSADIAAFNKV